MTTIRVEDVNTINKLAIATVVLPPGSMFQKYFLDEMSTGTSTQDIANQLVASGGFQADLPDSLSNEAFTNKFVERLAGGFGTKENTTWITNHVLDLLKSGSSRAEMVVAIVNELDSATSSDPHWGAVADLFHNRVILSSIYSGNSAHATDVEGMHRAMDLVTPDYASIAAAQQTIDLATTAISIIGSPVITEGGNAIYTVSRFGDLSVTSTIDFSITRIGASTSDYGIPSNAVNGITFESSAKGGTIVFPKFTSVASFILPITKDNLVENGESVTLNLVTNPLDTNSIINVKQASTTTLLQDAAKNMSLKGDSNANLLIGGNGKDTINGLGGNDTLVGGDGRDKLSGGAGNDIFKYAATTEGGDKITDFQAGDVLQFSQVAFGGTVGLLQEDNFLGGEHKVSAETTTQHFMYDTTTNSLYYDADASGGLSFSVLIATFTNDPTITTGNIWLV